MRGVGWVRAEAEVGWNAEDKRGSASRKEL